jgi:hypothetical protein
MALEGGEESASHPHCSLPPGKTWYPLYRRLGGPQGRSGQVRKISPPTRIRSPDCPGCSQSLYRLSYPAHKYTCGSQLYLIQPDRLPMTIQYGAEIEAYIYSGPGSVVGITTGYGLDGPGIESRWRRDFPHLSRPALGPTQPPVQSLPSLSRG